MLEFEIEWFQDPLNSGRAKSELYIISKLLGYTLKRDKREHLHPGQWTRTNAWLGFDSVDGDLPYLGLVTPQVLHQDDANQASNGQKTSNTRLLDMLGYMHIVCRLTDTWLLKIVGSDEFVRHCAMHKPHAMQRRPA